MVQASARSTADRSADLAECGWRFETVVQADGSREQVQVPLTPEEFLHPQEDYYLPNSTFHDRISGDAKDMLERRYEQRADVGVFRDLLMLWDDKTLKDCCPDVAVVLGLRDKDRNRPRFIVAEEGVRPAFVIEVVSPRYRRQDRETKVVYYAQAQVQEYAIVDRRTYRGQQLEEVVGYRLQAGHYQPITPDDEGRVYFETINVWMSLQDGQLVMEDAETGERLKTSRELAAELEQTEQRATQADQRAAQAEQQAAEAIHQAEQSDQRAIQAEQQAAEAIDQADQAEQRAAELAALLAQYQQQFGNLGSESPELRQG